MSSVSETLRGDRPVAPTFIQVHPEAHSQFLRCGTVIGGQELAITRRETGSFFFVEILEQPPITINQLLPARSKKLLFMLLFFFYLRPGF
jgi:hypothetical protein